MSPRAQDTARTPAAQKDPENRGDSVIGRSPNVIRPSHYLHAGLYFAAKSPTVVTTILGSCVAVCLWDPEMKVGGVNHFVLPDWVGKGRMSPRFGNVAVASLIEALSGFGCRVSNLRAKIFGGASILGEKGRSPDALGARNLKIALSLLKEEQIPLVAGDVGGRRGRKLVFHSDNGETWVRKL